MSNGTNRDKACPNTLEQMASEYQRKIERVRNVWEDLEDAYIAGFRAAREMAAVVAQSEVRPRMYEMGSYRLAERIRKLGEEE